MCHRCLYKRSVGLFENEKYIFITQLYCPRRSFDEKTYICDTYHKHLSRNEMPCQAIFSNIGLDSISELKDLKK